MKTRQHPAGRHAATRRRANVRTVDPAPRSAARIGARAATLLFALVLAGAAILACQTSFAGVFVFDDEFAIQRNPNIRALWPITQALSAPPESPVAARPVASLTLAINYALAPADARDAMLPGGPDDPPEVTARFLANVWGYHAMNLALHLLAALAVFGVVGRTLVSDPLRARVGPHSRMLAFVVALIWVVHPLTTDAVTYITQRTEVLMGLFYLLTLYCAIRAAGAGLEPRPRRWWTAAAVTSCALGMGSKQTMVTAPFIVPLWDWTFGPRATRDATVGRPSSGRLSSTGAPRLRWGLYAALASTWVILAAGLAVERWPHSIGMDREGWTPWTYLLTQAGVVVHYLRLSFVPAPLVIDYAGWPMARSILDVAPQAALLAVLIGLTAAGIVRRAPWAFAAGWFFALLAPSSSFLPLATEIAAERRMYTALVAVVALAVAAAYLVGRRVLERLVTNAGRRRTAGMVTAAALAGSVAFGLASLTLDRNRDYWSEERLWQDAVDKRPDNPRARLNYGALLAVQRRYPEAETELRQALRLKEPVAKAHLNLGSVLCYQRRFEEGVVHLERALALDPAQTTAHANLGEAYGALGRRAQAARHFRAAVEREPEKLFLLNRLGWLLATSPEDDVRDASGAVEVGERAARLTSRQDPLSLDTLAAAYAEAGRFEEAAAVAREALALTAGRGRTNRALADRLALYAGGRKFRESR